MSDQNFYVFSPYYPIFDLKGSEFGWVWVGEPVETFCFFFLPLKPAYCIRRAVSVHKASHLVLNRNICLQKEESFFFLQIYAIFFLRYTVTQKNALYFQINFFQTIPVVCTLCLLPSLKKQKEKQKQNYFKTLSQEGFVFQINVFFFFFFLQLQYNPHGSIVPVLF